MVTRQERIDAFTHQGVPPSIERRGGDDRLDNDLAGAEPIELLTPVEQNLQGTDCEAQSAEAEPVQFLVGVARGVG